MNDFDRDEVFQALFGGIGLNTADLVQRVLSLIRSGNEAERFGAITDIREEEKSREIDDELIRLLKEEVESGICEERIENIIFCLRIRSIKCRIGDNLKPDTEQNMEVGEAIRDVIEPLNRKNHYLFFSANAVSCVRRGLQEAARNNDMFAMKWLEKEGRIEKLSKVKSALERRKDAEEMKARMEKFLQSDGLRCYPEERGKILSHLNGV